jgi:hypothetical protein
MDQVLIVLPVDAGPHLVELRNVAIEYLGAKRTDMVA